MASAKTTHSRKMHFGRYDYAAFTSFFAYAAGSLAIPVALVNIATDLDFPLDAGGLSAGGLLHFARTVPMVAAMLLCGFMAGRIGNRKSLGVSVALMSVGVAICAFAPVYGVLFIALMIAGLGEGVIEGLATPFVQNLHENDQPGRYINFAHGFWPIGVFATVITSGLLLTLGVSWRYILFAVALLSLVPTALLFFPESKKHPYPESSEKFNAKQVFGNAVTIIKIPRFWLYFAAMFLAGGGEFGLTFWSASYIQLNYSTTAWSGGLGTTFFATGMIIGRTGWGYLIKQSQLKQLITYSAVAGVAVTIILPMLSTLSIFMILLFFAGLAVAPYWPSIQSYTADRLPRVDTTMLFILLSCAGIPGCGTVTWLMGYLGNATGSLTMSFYLIPACFIILTILIAFDWLILTRKRM
ncbi:MFS transporter [Planctomycetota bacterium]|nr:MFS transporter [Planctomycetota bacterium]